MPMPLTAVVQAAKDNIKIDISTKIHIVLPITVASILLPHLLLYFIL